MKKKRNIGCGSQGDWQLEVVLIDLHIRQCQAVIRECQTQVKQLQAERAALLAPHKKKRRRTWDDNTPMIRLVNLSQMEHFLALMNDWQKRSAETINPEKTPYTTCLVCEMPQTRDCGYAEIAVPLHPEKFNH